MKHRLTAVFALAAFVAAPAIASAAPLIYPDIPAKVSMDDHMAVVVPASTIASAAPLIYPDIPAKVSMDDHMAVVVPLASAMTASHKTALVEKSNSDRT